MQQNCWKTMLLKKRIWAVNQKLHSKCKRNSKSGFRFLLRKLTESLFYDILIAISRIIDINKETVLDETVI